MKYKRTKYTPERKIRMSHNKQLVCKRVKYRCSLLHENQPF